MQQIIALGGGGFSMEPDNLALDEYVIEQAGKPNAKVCFLAQASGESQEYTLRFYQAFSRLGCPATHLTLFACPPQDARALLLAQDVIYVGGGNTKSLLALWQAWELPTLLRDAYERGIVLAGISAGANCWFEQGVTDSASLAIDVLPCLGFLPGSFCPHYDGEAERRPTFHGCWPKGVSHQAMPPTMAPRFISSTVRCTRSCRRVRARRAIAWRGTAGRASSRRCRSPT